MVRFLATRRRRRAKIKARVRGTTLCPRLSVFRSNKYIYVQLIDDEKRRTVVAASSHEFKEMDKSSKVTRQQSAKPSTKIERAGMIGKAVAEKARQAGIKKIVFDRSGYKYHGRIKALAEGARGGKLRF